VKEALEILISAYQQLGYQESAANVQKVYAENFPDAKPPGPPHRWWAPWRRG
jgi:outer membrane protein assembly factor BamD (BamD/ComL family)